MAEVIPTVTRKGDGQLVVEWAGLAAGDTGKGANLGGYPVRAVQATGDATSVVMQGSNDGANYAAFPTAVDLDATADEIAELPTPTRFASISSVTAGADTTVTIIATTHR